MISPASITLVTTTVVTVAALSAAAAALPYLAGQRRPAGGYTELAKLLLGVFTVLSIVALVLDHPEVWTDLNG